LDITGLTALRGLALGDGLRIGAATTWSEIAEADLPPALAGLQAAARRVGGRQIQNMGTIGGNLCNASPAADGVPPLLTLNAEVELESVRGVRRIALSSFLQGPRKTALAPDEMMVAVLIPNNALAGRGSFLKLGSRAYLVISIAMVAARIVTDGRIVTEIALAVGACSAVAQRLPSVERALIGADVGNMAQLIRAQDVKLSPIGDVRASAEYRRDAAVELLARVLGEAVK
jgi:CO/xanthine dehydrogenase FAD-binding subunit